MKLRHHQPSSNVPRANGYLCRQVLVGVACLATLLGSPGAVLANGLAERYPLNGWASLEQVERALADVSAERVRIEQRFSQASRDCQQRFFANSCTREAQTQKSRELAAIDNIESDAIRYRRTTLNAERVRQREQAEAQRVRDQRTQAEERARNARLQQQLIDANQQAEAERLRFEQAEAQQRARNASIQQQFIDANQQAEIERLRAEQAEAAQRALNASTQQRLIEANQQAEAARTRAASLEAAQRAENARVQQRFIEAHGQRSGETIEVDADAAQRARDLERLRVLRDGPTRSQ